MGDWKWEAGIVGTPNSTGLHSYLLVACRYMRLQRLIPPPLSWPLLFLCTTTAVLCWAAAVTLIYPFRVVPSLCLLLSSLACVGGGKRACLSGLCYQESACHYVSPSGNCGNRAWSTACARQLKTAKYRAPAAGEGDAQHSALWVPSRWQVH